MQFRLAAAFGAFLLSGLFLAASAISTPAQGLSAATKGVPLPGKGPRAYINIIIDDLPNLELWSRLASDCDAFGMKTTLALNTAKATPEDYAIMARHVAAGHEIANHTRDHVPVSPTGVIRLRYYDPRAKSAYAVVDQTSHKLRIMVNEGAQPVAELDLAEDGRTPYLKQLVDALNDIRGVTAELGDPYYANLHSRFLADRDKVDLFFKNGLVPLFLDAGESARYEMAGAKTDIEAGLPGTTCQSMVYPFLLTDAVSRQVARDLGMTCGRVGSAGYAALGAPGGYDLFQIYAGKPSYLFGEDPQSPDFIAKVDAFLKKLKEVGGVCCLYSHGPDEFTNEQWKALLPLLAKDKEIAYVTLHDLATYVTKTAQLRDGKYYLPQGK